MASAFKLSLRFLDPAQLLLWSSLVSTLVMLAALSLQGRIRITSYNVCYTKLLRFESVFMQFWRIREKIMDINEATAGNRVISYNFV